MPSSFLKGEKRKMEKSYLCPLFWQHHESETVLRREIQKMRENGIGSFIIEARPHPHYLQKEWWEDLSLIIDEAKKQQMDVWIFDDGSYPSGTADGLIRKYHPEYTKKYLAHHCVDAIGPKRGTSILIEPWLTEGEKLVAVVAGRRLDGLDLMDGNSFVDLTDRVEDGILYFDIPEGEWRFFIFKQTEKGGEEWTKHYLNPLEPEGTRAFLNLIYEKHFEHFSEEFGKTVKGFFTDEPRFGNAPNYHAHLGDNQVLPWSDTLLKELSDGGLGDFTRLLPCLFYEAGEQTPDARFLYMDVVSRRFGTNFIGQIGDWCRAHGVRLIGHVIEENGAHARIGYGPGHYFRAMDGMDAAGIDVVNNIYPGRTDGKYKTMFNDFDTGFNHWGLSKMASSAAHLDPKKNGTAVCEAFGAYGWSEGLKTMKWITDAMCVRGINVIIPHAFSPKAFPDPDCPPHFYAGGYNPQFPFFGKWADYANRVCDRISRGRHIAPAAVLYHAEAEWGGAYEPFETVVKELMRDQIDCEVIPADILCDSDRTKLSQGSFSINQQSFGVLVVPYAEYLPPALLNTFRALAQRLIPVIFVKDFPKRYYFGQKFEITDGMYRTEDEKLPALLRSLGKKDISLSRLCGHLAYYHCQTAETDSYFLVNEHLYENVETEITFRDERTPVLYDPMEDRKYRIAFEREEDGSCRVSIRLRPYESGFLLFGEEAKEPLFDWDTAAHQELILPEDGWEISLCSYEPESKFEKVELERTENISRPDLFPEFSGTIRYERKFSAVNCERFLISLGEVYEAARVYVNGRLIGEKICPPYELEADGSVLLDGENVLCIEVANTLAKAHHDNLFDRFFVQEPSGLLGPVKISLANTSRNV